MSTLDVVESDHVRGPVTASVTLLVYGDYECPHTRALELALIRLLAPNAFRFVYRRFPLSEIHPHAGKLRFEHRRKIREREVARCGPCR